MKAHRPKILVVDDEPDVLRSVHDLFRLDYRVITCDRGEDAIEALSQPQEIHVVLSDQRMPNMTGVEVLRQAKGLQPDATRLLFTAYADIKAVIDAINQGNVFRYIAKPWEPEELVMLVRQAVEHHDLIVEKGRLLVELRQTNEELVEANRLKGAFIEVASHELNTPVTVVLGMTELWKLSQSPSASVAERGWVERIQSAGKRLATTVERLLKLIRAGDFRQTLDLRVTELDPLVRATLAELNPWLLARRQRVDLDLAPDLGAAEVDPAKLGDVLMNLLVNAIKFSPDGGTIRLSARAEGPDLVRFKVIDKGVGIDPDDQRHLFEPFFTGFDTLHHSSGDYQFCKRGIGLGLPLVKAFVELLGGTIECSSITGEGSTFAFTLPRLRSPAHLPVADALAS